MYVRGCYEKRKVARLKSTPHIPRIDLRSDPVNVRIPGEDWVFTSGSPESTCAQYICDQPTDENKSIRNARLAKSEYYFTRKLFEDQNPNV